MSHSMNTILAVFLLRVGGRGWVSDICRQMWAQTNFICILSRKLQLFLFFTCTHKYFKSWRRGEQRMGEGWNIKNDCWLVIAYIGAAYKNREGSPASLFRRCGTSDVRTMNIRNGNSNSAAAPVRPLDPMEREEWSATSLCFWLLFIFFHCSSLFISFLLHCVCSYYFACHAFTVVSSLFLPLSSFLLLLATDYQGTRRSVFKSGPADRLLWHKRLSSVPLGKSWDRKLTRNASFHIHSNLPFTNHPTITWATKPPFIKK